jgi:putative PIN family toxin of toxin-antitoxin system
MNQLSRLVLDTNVLVSSALRGDSIPHRVLLKARREGVLLASDATLLELHEVLLRSKFDRNVDRGLREALYQEYARRCQIVSLLEPIRACRDPKDDKFLEVAVHGRADAIVTGDQDLLALNPFRGIAILTPAQYLARV